MMAEKDKPVYQLNCKILNFFFL